MNRTSAFCAAIFIFLQMSCTNLANRKPAFADYVPTKCEAKFMEIGEEYRPNPERFKKLEGARKSYEYLKSVLPNEVAEKLAVQKPACETARDNSDLQRDIQFKIRLLAQDVHEWEERRTHLKTLLSSPMFSDPDYPEMSACLVSCGGGQSQCAQTCNVPDKLALNILSDTMLVEIRNGCPDTAEMRRNFEMHTPLWKKHIRQSSMPIYEDLAALSREAQAALNFVNASVNIPKVDKGIKCPLVDRSWMIKIRSAVATVFNGNTSGSGFYFTTLDGIRFATTEHIYNLTESMFESDSKQLTVTSGFRTTKRESLQFRAEPSMFHRAHDVVQARVEGVNRKGLSLMAANAVPSSDEPYFIAGFPKMSKYKFAFATCYFYGYGPRSDRASGELFWIFRCPLIEEGLVGMSGGPLLDKNGRAWGVFTGFNLFLGRIYVTPLGLADDGEVQVGFQQRFSSDHCVYEGDHNFRSCSVGPNFHDKHAP